MNVWVVRITSLEVQPAENEEVFFAFTCNRLNVRLAEHFQETLTQKK